MTDQRVHGQQWHVFTYDATRPAETAASDPFAITVDPDTHNAMVRLPTGTVLTFHFPPEPGDVILVNSHDPRQWMRRRP